MKPSHTTEKLYGFSRRLLMPIVTWEIHSKKCKISPEPLIATLELLGLTRHLLTPTVILLASTRIPETFLKQFCLTGQLSS